MFVKPNFDFDRMSPAGLDELPKGWDGFLSEKRFLITLNAKTNEPVKF